MLRSNKQKQGSTQTLPLCSCVPVSSRNLSCCYSFPVASQGLRQVGSCLFQGDYHDVCLRIGFLEAEPEKGDCFVSLLLR